MKNQRQPARPPLPGLDTSRFRPVLPSSTDTDALTYAGRIKREFETWLENNAPITFRTQDAAERAASAIAAPYIGNLPAARSWEIVAEHPFNGSLAVVREYDGAEWVTRCWASPASRETNDRWYRDSMRGDEKWRR